VLGGDHDLNVCYCNLWPHTADDCGHHGYCPDSPYSNISNGACSLHAFEGEDPDGNIPSSELDQIILTVLPYRMGSQVVQHTFYEAIWADSTNFYLAIGPEWTDCMHAGPSNYQDVNHQAGPWEGSEWAADQYTTTWSFYSQFCDAGGTGIGDSHYMGTWLQ
jgi:hypothetical protein